MGKLPPTHTLKLGPGTQKTTVLQATRVIRLLMVMFYLNNLVINGLPLSSLGSRERLEIQVVKWAEIGAEPTKPHPPS